MSATSGARLLSRTVRLQPPKNISLQIQYYQPLNLDRSLPTVLLLPFWGGSAPTFEAVQLKLSETHPANATIAVSYRGTGSSTRHGQDAPQGHDIPALAADVLALLEILGDDNDDGQNLIPSRSLVLCAHSMSAKVAWEVLSAINTGGEKSLAVTGLLLLAPAPVGPLVLPPEMREQQLSAYESIESAKWALKHVLMHRTPDDEILERLARDAVGMSVGAKRGWVEYGMKRESLEAVRKVAAELEAGGKLESFGVVVLVGEQDQVETVDKVRKETVGVLSELGFAASMRVVPGAGHLLPIETPEEVALQLGEML